MGYGPSPQIGYHHMARMVAKALQRSKPADLPVELATGMRATVRAHIHRLKHAARRGKRLCERRGGLPTPTSGAGNWPR